MKNFCESCLKRAFQIYISQEKPFGVLAFILNFSKYMLKVANQDSAYTFCNPS